VSPALDRGDGRLRDTGALGERALRQSGSGARGKENVGSVGVDSE